MRTLEELVDQGDSAFPLIQSWLAESALPVDLLEPSNARGEVLTSLQVTTRSPMGAIAYETGGILIDHGWLRILGSGHPKLPRSIAGWNAGRSHGHLLVADDVAGGFFAINGGGLGNDRGLLYYWAPDTLKWEPMGLGYSDFICWALSSRLTEFYEGLRWAGWEVEAAKMGGDKCCTFYPFLWTTEGSPVASSRKAIEVAEQYAFNLDAVMKMQDR